jgi:hypothetical protein
MGGLEQSMAQSARNSARGEHRPIELANVRQDKVLMVIAKWLLLMLGAEIPAAVSAYEQVGSDISF